jgi:hypothetical protein
MLRYLPEEKSEMTTLLQEFEEWLDSEYERTGDSDYNEAIGRARSYLEELKEKYKVGKND